MTPTNLHHDPKPRPLVSASARVSFVTGVVFALGLGISGMTRPDKVLAFLDVLGDWDPSLALVMLAAVLVYGAAYRVITRRLPAPLLHECFSLPTRRDVTARLLGGAALFGVGWGLLGLCPGPALTALATVDTSLIIFVLAMLGGMLAFNTLDDC